MNKKIIFVILVLFISNIIIYFLYYNETQENLNLISLIENETINDIKTEYPKNNVFIKDIFGDSIKLDEETDLNNIIISKDKEISELKEKIKNLKCDYSNYYNKYEIDFERTRFKEKYNELNNNFVGLNYQYRSLNDSFNELNYDYIELLEQYNKLYIIQTGKDIFEESVSCSSVLEMNLFGIQDCLNLIKRLE